MSKLDHAHMSLVPYSLYEVCSVMIESFISTQKCSVQKMLAKKFRNFLVHAHDMNDLVMHQLQV